MGLPRRLASAARFQKAWDNYVQYLQKYDERPDGVGKGEAKPPQQLLYVHPFGIDFNDKIFYQANGTKSRWDTYKGNFGARTGEVITTGGATPDFVVKSSQFRPARAVIRTNILANGTRKVSNRTKLPYLNYGGKSGSVPFGASGSGDDEVTAFNSIFNAFKQGNSIPAGLRLSRVKEKI